MSAILERLRKQAKEELKQEQKEEKKSKPEKEEAKVEVAVKADKDKKAEKKEEKKAAKGLTGIAAIKAAAAAKKKKVTEEKPKPEVKKDEKKVGIANGAIKDRIKARAEKLKKKEATDKKKELAAEKKEEKKVVATSKVKLKGSEIQTAAGFFYTQHLTSPSVEKKENIEGTSYYISNYGRVYSKKNNGDLKECITLIYGRIPIADLRASGDRLRFKIVDMIADYFSVKQAKRFSELNNDYIITRNKKNKAK